MKHLLSFLAVILVVFNAKSQNVGIGTATPATILDVVSTTQGVLIPRVTTLEMNAIASPANGLLVTNTDSANRIFIYTGAAWQGLAFTSEQSAAVDTSLLVHKAGTETITGVKTFVPDIIVNGLTVGRGLGNVSGNTAIGDQALRTNTTGNINTAIGFDALYSNTTGNTNVANGYSALFSNTTGNTNVANGNYSLFSNTTGIENTATGNNSLRSNTTGNDNVANGNSALFNNSTGSDNVASGDHSLYFNTTGITNSANGSYSLYNNTTGNSNVAKGDASLFSNTTGGFNVADGVNSLFFNTTGNNNTGIGNEALRSNTTGSNNIANGNNAGRFITGGVIANSITNNSIFLGANTKAQATNQTNQIVIGDNATGLGSNTAIIGNSSTITTGISGKLFLATGLNVAPLSATDTGTTGEIRITSTFIYVCIATNVWVRTALTTW
jgi:trimeric autotransporter adhesin